MALADRITTRRPAATAASLQHLEGLVERVPDQLVAFLRTTNGGKPQRSFLAVPTPWGRRKVQVLEFYAAQGHASSVEKATIALRQERLLPPTVLAFASLDNYGSVLCISAEADTHGHVYFWDANRAVTELASIDRLSDFAGFIAPIASSLDELAGLLMDEHQTDVTLTAIPEPSTPPPEMELRGPRTPTWMRPTPLAEVSPASKLFVYRPGEQPDALRSKPLAEARDNSGVAFADVWDPPEVSWFRSDTGEIDLIDAAGLLVVRSRASELVGPLLEQYGELLPFTTNTGPLFIFRCLTVVDALEPEFVLAPSGQTSEEQTLNDFHFVEKAVAEAGIFTLPQQPAKPVTFFTRPVVEAIASSGASHLSFTPVWPDALPVTGS